MKQICQCDGQAHKDNKPDYMAQFEAIRNCTVERELQVRIDRYLVEEYEELRPFVIE